MSSIDLKTHAEAQCGDTVLLWYEMRGVVESIEPFRGEALTHFRHTLHVRAEDGRKVAIVVPVVEPKFKKTKARKTRVAGGE